MVVGLAPVDVARETHTHLVLLRLGDVAGLRMRRMRMSLVNFDKASKTKGKKVVNKIVIEGVR